MDSALLIALRLAKEGFGTPEQVMAMATDLVLAALEYITFRGEYEDAYEYVNRKD